MSKVVPELTKELIIIGYNAEECKQILSQIVMIAYGADFCDTIDEVKGVYFLSFCDEMFPQGSVHAAKEFLDKRDIINMVKTDRDLLKLNTNRSLLSQFMDFLTTHKRVYSLRKDNNIRLFGYGALQGEDGYIWEQDHSIIGLSRNEDWSKHENASSVGDCVSRGLACALCSSVANSIQNNQNTQHVEFDMEDLYQNIDNICRIHNYEQTKLDDIGLQTK